MRKRISKFILCLMLLLIVTTIIQYFITNETFALPYTTYDIDGIDESKYPGYKSALKAIKEAHPNWKIKLYYTGLDWQTVINNETTGHGGSPKSLIYDTYDGEWICPYCGTKKYDISQRWYCASQEAVKFMMDPRNSLTEEYIFQFQDISSSVGDKDAIKKITEGTFLYNDSYIDAIIKAANDNGLSPFHIVSRIIQEQGEEGTGPYVKGYEYNGRLVYNLFNIGATGGAGNYENGAKRAYEEGWFSIESSIIGGTKFIKDNYINRGQVSLYFQKYNVVETGNLYNNQYMQNIGAPRSEASMTYSDYKEIGIENSSFEFVIPIYNNMPYYASYKPNESYMGNINTEVKLMNLIESNGHKYISGEIDIAEWINDTCYTPKGTPEIYLKSTDGTFSKKMFSYYKQEIRYYFDTIVDTLDVTKDYYIEVQLNSPRNAGTEEMKKQKASFPDKNFGTCGNGTIKAEGNLLKFTYVGTIDTSVNDIEIIQSNGKNYIRGTVDIAEVVNGVEYVPGELPELKLKSTDGTFTKNLYRYYQNDFTYYFDTTIDKLDKTKEYYIEAKLVNTDNIGTEEQKTQILSLPNKELGLANGNYVKCEDNKIKFTYQGTIDTQLQNLDIKDNGAGRHYICGNIDISEIINGDSQIPSTLPELKLKSTDGYSQNMYINHSGNGSYYFDTYVEELDRTKEYYIEARLSNINNIASEEEKTEKVVIEDKELGKLNDNYKLIVKDGNMKFIDAELYIGKIETQIENLAMNANQEGNHYIYGNIKISEIVEGVNKVPTTLPELHLKTSEGFDQKMYIYHSGNGSYYFDTYIENIDNTKQYYIEAILTNPKNLANSTEKTQKVVLEDNELGKIKDKKVIINNSELKFIDADKYEGTISTKITNGINFNDNGAGRHYISGNIDILEIINGKSNVPTTLPELTLKSTDGYSQKMYIYHSGNGNYYFDTYIEDLDMEKQYYIEAKLTNKNNIAQENKKVQKVELEGKELGKLKGKKVVIENSNIQFIDGDKYQGTISTKITDGIYLRDNGAGRHYICGNIQIKETINGKVSTPEVLPELTLKSEDGYVQKMYIAQVGDGIYYFDTYVEELDTTKQYYIEAKLTDPNNTSSQKAEIVSLQEKELGSIKQDGIMVSIKDNKLVFTSIKSIENNIETETEILQENIKENIEVPQDNVEVNTESVQDNPLEKEILEEEK